MISTFSGISACWVHQHGGKVVDMRGDAFYILRYPPITTYKIISNRKANGTCFLDFTKETHKSPQLNFLRIIDRQLIAISQNIMRKDCPTSSYLQDINHQYFQISANRPIPRDKVKQDLMKPEKFTVLKPLLVYDERIIEIEKPPPTLEPYAMFSIFSHPHDSYKK